MRRTIFLPRGLMIFIGLSLADKRPLIMDYRLTALSAELNITRLAQLCLMGYFPAVTELNFSSYSYTWAPPALVNAVSGSVLHFNSPFVLFRYVGNIRPRVPVLP